MRALGFFLVVACVGGCGGSVAVEHGSGSGGSAGAPAAIGVGPIDASAEPATLVTKCDGTTGTVTLKLPCLLGGDLGSGLSELECQLSSAPDGSAADVALNLMIPLGQVPMLLNQPISLPFNHVSPPPAEGGGEIDGYPGERFSATLVGTASFSQVDLVGRAFVGRLQRANVNWMGDRGDSLSCAVVDGPFWAVAGTFF